MITIRRRKQDRDAAKERLEEAVRKVIDVAVRRSRLEADIQPVVFRATKGGHRDDRSD